MNYLEALKEAEGTGYLSVRLCNPAHRGWRHIVDEIALVSHGVLDVQFEIVSDGSRSFIAGSNKYAEISRLIPAFLRESGMADTYKGDPGRLLSLLELGSVTATEVAAAIGREIPEDNYKYLLFDGAPDPAVVAVIQSIVIHRMMGASVLLDSYPEIRDIYM